MDNLQYVKMTWKKVEIDKSFKPYYKWITFNILNSKKNTDFMVV